MPIVIGVDCDRVWDTHYITIRYSDKSARVVEIEEGAEKGEECKVVDNNEHASCGGHPEDCKGCQQCEGL